MSTRRGTRIRGKGMIFRQQNRNNWGIEGEVLIEEDPYKDGMQDKGRREWQQKISFRFWRMKNWRKLLSTTRTVNKKIMPIHKETNKTKLPSSGLNRILGK